MRGTNFPMWLDGAKRDPSITYAILREQPLRLSDEVVYTTDKGEKRVSGVDRARGDHFVWRGKGPLRLFASRWAVTGVNDDATVVVTRFAKTLATPAGLDVLVREGAEVDELRSLVANNAAQFGLTPEDFASLAWLH